MDFDVETAAAADDDDDDDDDEDADNVVVVVDDDDDDGSGSCLPSFNIFLRCNNMVPLEREKWEY